MLELIKERRIKQKFQSEFGSAMEDFFEEEDINSQKY